MALTKVTGEGVGNVDSLGIGTASPSHPLHIVTSTDGTGVSGDDKWAAVIQNAEATDARSYGLKIMAGSTTDQPLAITDHDGSNDLMAVDGYGHVTMPKQSAFFARSGSNSSAYSIDGWNTIAFVTERFDNNADFSSPNFTAPITGRYQLNVNIRLSDLDNDADYYQLKLVTSNYNYYFALIDPGRWSGTLNYYSAAVSVLADMDASDTAYVQIYQGAGAQQTYSNDNDCHFSGYLVA